jgi:hypothetical protein
VASSLGSPYTVEITASNVAGSVSQGFTLTVIPSGYSLAFVTQPGGGTAGAAWSQQPVVEVVDSQNQVVTTDNTTVVFLGMGTNPAGGTLTCTNGTSATVVNGYATFSGCSIDIASSSAYTLSATGYPAWTPATSTAFSVSVPEAPRLTAASAGGTDTGTSGFSTVTKLLKIGQSITIRVQTSPQLAGTTLGVWIAKKGSNGTWGAFTPHASVTTDATGTAYYTYTFGSRAWLAFRFYSGGGAASAPAWSNPSQFGRAM